MRSLVWRDGTVMSPDNAVFKLTSDASLRGISVFEGVMAYRRNGGLYAVISLEEHIQRLRESAFSMRLAYPDLREKIFIGIRSVLRHFSAEQVYVRPTIYLADGYYSSTPDVRMFISARTIVPSPSSKTTSCAIVRVRHVSPDAYPSNAKIGAMYAFFRLARLEAQDAGADEAILLSTDGVVAETPGASIFAVRKRVAHTPPVSVGILPSITRQHAIKLLETGVVDRVEEARLRPDFVRTAEEVFLTGTMDEILPVATIDGELVGTGQGVVGSTLRQMYLQACRAGEPNILGGTVMFDGSADEG